MELLNAMEREENFLVKLVHCLNLITTQHPNDFREGSAVQKMKVAKAAAGKIMAARPRNDRRLSKLEEEFRKMT